jgi:hypothetical protein
MCELQGLVRLRTVWRSLFVAFLLVAASSAADQIRISAELDTATHSISGWVTVTWPTLESAVSDLRFRLYANLRTDLPASASLNRSSDSTYTNVDTLVVGDVDLTDRCTIEGTDLSCPTEQTYTQGESLAVRLHFTTHVAPLSGGMDRLFFTNGEYLLNGWFPMPAPRRCDQWVKVTYSESAELVGDFFDFDVQLQAPESLRVAGAGLVSADTSKGVVLHSFLLPAAHDFALYLSPDIVLKRYAHESINITVYATPRTMYVADLIAEVCGQTLDSMGKWVAPYPFSELHVVLCELGFSGGIELPRMIVCSAPSGSQFLGLKDVVMIHEVVHQWFYGIINSDQAATPWLDEAVSDYFTERVSRALYGEKSFFDWWGVTLDYGSLQRLQGLVSFDRLPITLPADRYFSMGSYVATVYNKGAVTLRTLLGHLKPADEFSFWHRYYDRWRFAAPGENDFTGLLSEYEPYVGSDVAVTILHNTGAVDYLIERIANEPITADNRSADSSLGGAENRPQYRSTVDYAMYNPIGLPVTMRLSFADGNHRDTLLLPRAGQARLAVVSGHPLVAAALDPDTRIGLDKNLLNNSLSLSGNSTGLRLFSGITFLIESLFSYVWGM